MNILKQLYAVHVADAWNNSLDMLQSLLKDFLNNDYLASNPESGFTESQATLVDIHNTF